MHGFGVSNESVNQLNAAFDRNEYEQGLESKTSGALSVSKGTSMISVSGAQAFSLANGTFEGQRKTIMCTAADNTGTLTPATFTGGTTIAFDAAKDQVVLQWSFSGGWRVVWLVGAAIS